MVADNSDRIAEWNGPLGRRWAEFQPQIDAMAQPLTDALMAAAAAKPGERVIDVGCGSGHATLELALQVGEGGHVLGVDVSRPMLSVARALVQQSALNNVSFLEADAAHAPLPPDADLLLSRFGLMFFSEPVAALSHLGNALRPGGRCVSLSWRTPRDNAWVVVPLVAVRKALGIIAPATEPEAPGPFAFADPERVQRLFSRSGFESIEIRRFDAPMLLGRDLPAAVEFALCVGPTAHLARQADPEHMQTIRAAVERALAPFAGAHGHVWLNGSTWIVAARRPTMV
jgi:ubiquinone/menaquinone biosynthesis C-methylase UbiE